MPELAPYIFQRASRTVDKSDLPSSIYADQAPKTVLLCGSAICGTRRQDAGTYAEILQGRTSGQNSFGRFPRWHDPHIFTTANSEDVGNFAKIVQQSGGAFSKAVMLTPDRRSTGSTDRSRGDWLRASASAR
jgi:hypothetical protein